MVWLDRGSFDFLSLAGLLNVTFSFHCHLSPPALDTGSKKEYGTVWFDRGSFDFFGRLAGFVHVTFSFQCPLHWFEKGEVCLLLFWIWMLRMMYAKLCYLCDVWILVIWRNYWTGRAVMKPKATTKRIPTSYYAHAFSLFPEASGELKVRLFSVLW